MGQSFPTSQPSYPDTTGGETLGAAGGGLGLSRILDDYGLDITGTTTKVGTGSSTPTSGKVLRANGTGTSVWGAADLTTDVTGTLPVANGGTGITSLGSGVATFLGTPSSANLASAVTGETGSGALVFGTSPTLTTPNLGTPSTLVLTNATGLVNAGLSTSAGELGGAWTTWAPTYGATGSMTYTSVTTTYAKYMRVGKTVHFQLRATGTTGGTTSAGITFTLPIASASEHCVYAARVSPGGVNVGGIAFNEAGSTTVVDVTKYDLSNIALAAGTVILVGGSYET